VGSASARSRVTGAITFDAGALIAIERRSRRMQALLEEIDRRDWQVAVPAGAVAQAWRGGPRQARIAALLSDERTEVVALDDPVAPRSASCVAGRATPMWSMSRLPSARGSGTCMSLPPIQRICVQSMTPSSCTCHEGTVGRGETAPSAPRARRGWKKAWPGAARALRWS